MVWVPMGNGSGGVGGVHPPDYFVSSPPHKALMQKTKVDPRNRRVNLFFQPLGPGWRGLGGELGPRQGLTAPNA